MLQPISITRSMHILATPYPHFCHTYDRRSLSFVTPRTGWACKFGSSQDNTPYTTRHIQGKHTSTVNTTGVYLQHGKFKPNALKQDAVELRQMEESVEYIKNLLRSMDDGQISVSPYDTAWVALIKDVEGLPQFPSSINWIANNQLSDGSWGDPHYFLAEDCLLSTLACIVALKSWSLHLDKVEKGVSFVKENVGKLKEVNGEYATCGFELVFPVLVERAQALGIEGLPYDGPVVKEVSAARDRKLEKLGHLWVMDMVPTSLMSILEGLENLDWPKLIKWQTLKGLFLTSPAAAAFVFMHNMDEDCLRFVKTVVHKFNGGAPTTYPVDIFARIWAVDHLQRLGISRFFGPEIQNCLDHVYRFWTEKGLSRSRASKFCDLDNTSMGFRLLRLHGYNVSPNPLRNFKKDCEFTCYIGEEFKTPSVILNLHRASQLQFPGETLLDEASEFSSNFLQQKLEKNQLVDKWLISKHLPDEVRKELEVPWYASLPRLETYFYIHNYGVDDIWIGKSLYRMPEISNEAYLELAKLDYNRCQQQHQLEWNQMQRWYKDYNLDEFGISKRDLLIAYFLASASIFEPERSGERLAWVKSQVILNIISTYYLIKEVEPSEHSVEFPTRPSIDMSVHRDAKGYKNIQQIIAVFLETLRQLAKDAQVHTGRDISDLLQEAWGGWLKKLGEGLELKQEAELVIRTVNICGGHIVSKEILSHHGYKTLSSLTNKICHQLSQFGNENVSKGNEGSMNRYKKIGKDMQLLVQLVLQDSSNDVAIDIKQTFLLVAKTFYYRAYFTAEQIENHVSKVHMKRIV